MADRPSDQNAFSIRGLDGPLYRLRIVAKQHPPGSDNLGFTQIDPRAPWWQQILQSFTAAQEAENPLGTIIANNQPRVNRVLKALRLSMPQARQLIGYESGDAAGSMVMGILPALATMAKWAGAGAAVGATIGALAGPADEITVPGGAIAGMNVGLWFGGAWGLKDLFVGVAQHLGKFTQLAQDAVELAWYAGEDPRVPEISDLNDAAEFFAYAIAELWMVLLEALVLAVMHRAGKLIGNVSTSPAARAALADVSDQLSKSKLGADFGTWFERNFDQIQKRVEEWKKERKKEGSGGSGTDGDPTPAQTQPPPGSWRSANESMSARAAAYQSQISGQPPGQVYIVNGVKFDGYDGSSLLDAKGPGYANFVGTNGEFKPWWNGTDSLLDQADRQTAAAGSTPITWAVAEKPAADAMRSLLQQNGFSNIDVVHVPAQP
jgi:hypothetical protein